MATTVAAAWSHFGRVDVLVNGAGVVAEAPLVPEKVPPELFEQTVRVNLMGTWYCCREVAALMLADGKGGSIINISSVAGMSGTAGFLPAVPQRDDRPGVRDPGVGHTLVVDGGLSAASAGGGIPEEVSRIFEQIVPNGLGKRIQPA